MFVMLAVSTIPVNVYLIMVLNRHGLICDSAAILGILRVICYYMVLLSVEEILMGVITGLPRRKQYVLDINSGFYSL